MVQLRFASPADAETILSFIQALADYEREPSAVETDATTLRQQLAANQPPFECLIAELDSSPVGFALFFQSYSTWRGRPGIWLEDLFVLPQHRGVGVGKALLKQVAAIAHQRRFGRLEWSVLDWNESAIAFYRSLGAEAMNQWTTYRVSDQALSTLADAT